MALEEVGELGAVVGIDLRPTDPIDGASLLTGDVRDESIIARLSSENSDEAQFSGFRHIPQPDWTIRY